jgi:hypothetical protein
MHTACMTKHVEKHTHHSERELTYNVALAHVLVLLDLREFHFKFHDRIKHCPINFHSATLWDRARREAFLRITSFGVASPDYHSIPD